MGGLKNPRLIYAKAAGFLAIILLACAEILLETRSLKIAALLAILIWSSARLYYFMFYVIEKYVDPGFKYAGVIDLLRYLCGMKR